MGSYWGMPSRTEQREGNAGDDLTIERVATSALSVEARAALLALCDAAYGEPMARYLDDVGPGEHLLGWRDGRLVSHLMWVTRELQPAGMAPLRTAYVELVATGPESQGRGYATQLLEAFPPLVGDYQLAALSPATDGLYRRLGWRFWRGPLTIRTDAGLVPTPDEQIMILRLARTPLLDDTVALSAEWRPGEVW
jgi:aminoglycoside 2'-N-acetyltransferase I